jgi:hypothetical protein
MKVVYYADDGTEFETEQECRDYELKTADFFEECVNVRAYDDDGTVVDFRDYDIECMEDAFQDIWFIQFTTQKAIDLFLEKGQHEFGLLYIDEDIHRDVKVGERYFYDTDKDEWVCLEDRQRELDKIANMFK